MRYVPPEFFNVLHNKKIVIYTFFFLQLLTVKVIRGIRTPISLLFRNNNVIISNDLAIACEHRNVFPLSIRK